MRGAGDPQVNPRKYGEAPYRVVLVHGGPGAPGEMAPVARELSRDFGILEPLQTAHTLDGQVEELKLQIESDAQVPVTLVGYSWGAFLGFTVTARYPALVRKLILVSSGPLDAQYAPLIMQTRLSRLSGAEQTEVEGIRQRLDNSSGEDRSILFARSAELLSRADQYDPVPGGRETSGLDAEAFAAVWKEAQHLRARGGLLALAPKILCPVVAIHGDYDPHPAEGVKEPLSAVLMNFTFVLLEKCGHTPWLENRARTKFYSVLRAQLM